MPSTAAGKNGVFSVLADLRSPPVIIHNPEVTRKALAVLEKAGAFLIRQSDTGLLHLLCKGESEEDPVYNIDLRPISEDAFTLRAAYLAGDGTLRSALCNITGHNIPIPDGTYKVVIKKNKGRRREHGDISSN